MEGTHEAREFSKKAPPIVALAGNPNVGKSTVFNALTGLHQHTGNWAGKTVGNAVGLCHLAEKTILLVDIPGTYSLLAHSAEEEVARDFVCFDDPAAVVVVADATCLSRNLNLLLQIGEVAPRTVLCVNLLDEAKKKGIDVDLKALSDELGIPVVGTVARKKRTLTALLSTVLLELEKPAPEKNKITYPAALEKGIAKIEAALAAYDTRHTPTRWLALRLLEGDETLLERLKSELPALPLGEVEFEALLRRVRVEVAAALGGQPLADTVVGALTKRAEAVAAMAVSSREDPLKNRDRRIDAWLTGVLAYPTMLLMLAFVFWLTIAGANAPSALLASLFQSLGTLLSRGLSFLGAPSWLLSFLMDGIYGVLTTVVAVMLPPMAIFFPLFTLLEDVGYLPRVAYNLDRPLCCCHACGKQALTMCMGFGCNAAGVVGCRIIDSKRERLLAILTNAFVPCNGRFPTMVLLFGVFFAGQGILGSILPALLLTLTVLLGIVCTFLATALLSATVLRGTPSAFTLELPPYRMPQVGKILVRSLFDRTLFVLSRAVAVAAPAGAVIWLLGNLTLGEASLLSHMTAFFDPFAAFLGLDGVIFTAFLLGFPANEIVLPLALMAYLGTGALPAIEGIADIGAVLTANGWTLKTAVCFILFSLLHWPCSTTVLTVKKETGSLGYTALSVLLPTLFGMLLCMAVNGLFLLLGF